MAALGGGVDLDAGSDSDTDVDLPGLEAEEGSDSDPDSEMFSYVAHCSDLVCPQNEQRRLALFCDITLAFGGDSDEEEETEVGGAFRSGRVELRKWSSGAGPDPETIEAVISFLYTGSIPVNPGKVQEVLELADRFLLIHPKEFCGDFLNQKLSLSNSVTIHSLAHMYSLNQLALKAAEMIRRNFYKVIEDDEFYTLPFHLIRDWLSDSEITVDSEEILFEMVLKWVQRNPDEREKYFEELFKLLRLSQIKPTYLTRHVKSEKLVSRNEACLKLLLEAVESHALKGENFQLGTQVNSSISSQPRFGQNMDVIMVIGGVSEGGDYLSECVGYFIDEDRWVNLPHIHNHLDGHAVVVTKSCLYVAGSMEPGFAKTMERYNPGRNVWEQVSNLLTRKHSFGLTEVKGNLYCIGGHANFISGFKDVAVYNPDQDKWHKLESAPKILRDVKMITVDDRFVYMAARTPDDGDNEDGLRSVIIRYDADTRQWRDCESLPLLDNYCCFQMVVGNTNFYHTACCPRSYPLDHEEAREKSLIKYLMTFWEAYHQRFLALKGRLSAITKMISSS
uniref:BACK domain-containing protein n=1 Tax=Naja naja TaxID=35670 RepID=A0A8C6XTM4_NAJNA